MKFHYLARGIIFKDGKVLLAHQKGAGHTFLPGGHIAKGEKAETALVREIEEEIGEKAIVKRFIGAVEAGWSENDKHHHEINLVFEVDIPHINPGTAPRSLEGQLEFLWARLAELKTHNLLPEPMIQCLENWGHSYQGFWGSAFR